MGVWDSLEARSLGACRGHRGSVKAVTPCPGAPEVFASGGRDGALLVWDARVPGRGGGGGGGADAGATLSPVAAVAAAHGAPSAGTPAPRRGGPPGAGRAAPHSVTSAAFLADGRVLASGGADGLVRLWDVRALRPVGGGGRGGGGGGGTAALAAVCPVAEAAAAAAPCCGGRGGAAPPAATTTPTPARTPTPHAYPHGVCGLALDPAAGARLAASVAARGHFIIDAGRLSSSGGGGGWGGGWGGGGGGGGSACAAPHHPPGTVRALASDGPGSAPSSFYVKAAFSGDGSHLVGGCGDGVARVWHTGRPDARPLRLVGHAAEVTGVAWCPTDGGEVATCSDDATVRVWRLVRREEEEEEAGGGGGRGVWGGGAFQPSSSPPPATPAGDGQGWPGRAAPVAAATAPGPARPPATAGRPPRAAPSRPRGATRPEPPAPATAPHPRLAQRSIFDFVSPMQQPRAGEREEAEAEEEEEEEGGQQLENRAPHAGAGGSGRGGGWDGGGGGDHKP